MIIYNIRHINCSSDFPLQYYQHSNLVEVNKFIAIRHIVLVQFLHTVIHVKIFQT